MGHVIADFPDPKTIRDAIGIMAKSGVKIIEIQIPFSEPMADGPVFMKANHAALAKGVDRQAAFALMKEVAAQYPQVNFVFMSYLNVIYRFGYRDFCQKAKEIGAKGVIIPDLPLEHAHEFDKYCLEFDFSNIKIIPPNASEERIDQILASAQGLVYVVARRGVTGAKSSIDKHLISYIESIRRKTSLPLGVGFGIQSADDVSMLSGHVDYAIVGTKAFRVLETEGVEGLKQFWDAMTAAI